MSIGLIAALMFGSMMALLMTGRHIFFIVGGVGSISALLLWGTGGVDMVYYASYAFMRWAVLLAIPLFVFMGLILARSGIADDLFQAIYVLMGRVKGGLAMGTIGLCSMVAAMTGTNVTATVTAGYIALPAMLKRKYDKLMLTGVVQAGGALGFLIPPSIIFILYGLIARASIGQLWLAGILPGALLAGMYVAYIGIRCRLNPSLGPPIPEEERAHSMKEKFIVLRAGIAPVIIIFVVLGLLFMGVTSLTECGAIGVLGALVAAAIHRKLNWQMLRECMRTATTTTALIMWIFLTALLFGAVFDGLGAVNAMEHLLSLAPGGKWGILIVMQLSFFFFGMALDDTVMLLIVAPLYIPIVHALGFDLIWYGVLYVLNCQMAYITPPFGYNLFIIKGIVPKDSGITIVDIYRSVIPFVGIQAACLGIVMAFPQIALWIPNLVFK